jgi:hypothetical protein
MGDVEMDESHSVPELIAERRALVVEDVAGDHPRSLGDQRPGMRGAHTPRPSLMSATFPSTRPMGDIIPRVNRESGVLQRKCE